MGQQGGEPCGRWRPPPIPQRQAGRPAQQRIGKHQSGAATPDPGVDRHALRRGHGTRLSQQQPVRAGAWQIERIIQWLDREARAQDRDDRSVARTGPALSRFRPEERKAGQHRKIWPVGHG